MSVVGMHPVAVLALVEAAAGTSIICAQNDGANGYASPLGTKKLRACEGTCMHARAQEAQSVRAAHARPTEAQGRTNRLDAGVDAVVVHRCCVGGNLARAEPRRHWTRGSVLVGQGGVFHSRCALIPARQVFVP